MERCANYYLSGDGVVALAGFPRLPKLKEATVSSQRIKSTNPTDGATGDATKSESVPDASPHTPEQFRRIAELVASGELPLPRHLSDGQLARLAREVQQIRRKRLIDFVAQAIADDIVQSHEPKHGG